MLGNESGDVECPYDKECIENDDCSCDTEHLECKIVEGLAKRCVVVPVAASSRFGMPSTKA
jgi:hypothetical protein